MEIDDRKIERALRALGSACEVISRIHLWLPEAIDRATNKHPETLDRIFDPDKMRKEKREEEKIRVEMDSLRDQVEEMQMQTKEIRKQTWYLMGAFIIAFLGFLLNAILQISPDLFGLLER